MKHLKKLSVVLMITTLFSASFTSCIDTEVSPVVEAIYEAQADLIAAQTAVQNAEAALRNAQANAAQAQADYTAAQTAQVEAITAGIEADNAHQAALREQELRLLVAQTDLEVNEAQNALAIAEEEFKLQMAALVAELEEAGVQLAIEYAYKYRNAMYAANNILSDKLDAEEELADAQLMLVDAEDMTYEYHLAQLQNEVTMYEAEIAYITNWLALLNEDAADPLAVMETLKVQIADLEAQEDAMDILMQEQWNKVMALYDQDDNRDDALSRAMDALNDHNNAVNGKISRETQIANAQSQIAAYQAAMVNYEATKTALNDAVQAALDRIGAEEADNHPSNHAPGYGLLGDIETKQAEIDALNADTPTFNAAVTDAQNALSAHQTALDGLVATYNAAVTALAIAQNTFDTGNYDALLTSAQTALTTFQAGAYQDAVDNYNAAKTAFEADPSGSTDTDTDGNHSNFYTASYNSTFDLGEIGIHTDLAGDTYMRVATWKETTLGSGKYIPATLYPTKYNTADLAVEAAALIADAGNGIGANADIWLWEDNVGDMDIDDIDGNEVTLDGLEVGSNTDLHALGANDAIDADAENIAVFINVESDDDSISHEVALNAATNMLGQDDFSDRDFMTGPATFEIPLVPGDTSAGYNAATPENDAAAHDTLTARAELWNLQLAVEIAQFNKDNAAVLLQAAIDLFNEQKALYDDGLATQATLAAAVATAQSALNAHLALIATATNEKNALLAELGSDDYSTRDTSIASNLELSWDDHANDGLPVGSEIYDILASAKWDSDGDTNADSLTAYAELWNAQNAYDDHTNYSLAQYQSMIDGAQANIDLWNAEIANIIPIIDAKYAVVTGLFPTLDNLGVEYTFEVDAAGLGTLVVINFGELSSLYSDLHAAIIAEWQVYWDLELQDEMIHDEQDYLEDLLDEYEDQYENLFDDIADFEDDLATAQDDLEEAKAALALATNDKNAAEAYITYLEAKIANLEVRHANALAIAAQYKALMDAALAS
ncbi:hypothetical protein ACFQZW_06250 [Lutibacter aestuarii]|uniref:Uncharacterized protein n=1 Tax=Lutibacter aestuarii TaxID=861111 RepID=A0ABW2Z4D3_9FLAO